MFIILGLFILVVSFVVALVTLLRDQKNFDNTAVTPRVDVGIAKDPIGKITQQEVSVPQPVAKEKLLEETALPQIKENAFSDFSWKIASRNDNDRESEQQKIEEIRAELARIAGEKVSKQDNETIIGMAADSNESSLATENVNAGDKLSGEISLRQFKGGE